MGENISNSLQEIAAAKAAIRGSIERKGVSLANTPFTQYADKIDAISGGSGEVDTAKYYVIINVTNDDNSDLSGQIVTVNGTEYPLTGTLGIIKLGCEIGDIFTINFNFKEEFYQPSTIVYEITKDVVIKLIDVMYVSIAKVVTYGYKITEATADPLVRVEYTEDSIGKVKGSSDWDLERIFKEIKPCLFKEGKVVGYLNPNDFTQFEDGTAADITTGNAGDVMIEFPKIAYKMNNINGVVTASITNNPDAKSVDPEYSFNAFSRENEGDQEHCYIGAYLGWVDTAGKLRSLSGKVVWGDKTIGEFRACAKANGEGYQQFGFYQLTLLQHLYLVRCGSTDSQKALGMGNVGGIDYVPQGSGNKLGMWGGYPAASYTIKMCGVEDFYGNAYCFIDGCFCDENWNVLTAYKNFNDTGTGYFNNGIVSTTTNSSTASIREIAGGTLTGFTPKVGGGGLTSYYCDTGSVCKNMLAAFGGGACMGRGAEKKAGAFALAYGYTSVYKDTKVIARLCYV